MAGPKDLWARLARNLKTEIDGHRFAAYRSMVSQLFGPGEHGRVAVKIVRDRSVERL